jgi:ATP-dependent DNA helicase RecG
MEALGKDIQYLKGVGPKRSLLLKKIGIDTVFDLLWYIPRGYYSRTQVQPIKEMEIEKTCSIRGCVMATSLKYSRRGMSVFQVLVQDASGVVTAVWFNQPFLSNTIKKGRQIWVRGKVKMAYNNLQIQVQEYDLIDVEAQSHPVIPIYALTEGLTQRILRRLVDITLTDYLPHYTELLNPDTALRFGLTDIRYAFKNIHFPADRQAYNQARRRLACEELLLFRLGLRGLKTQRLQSCQAIIHAERDQLVEKVIGQLPYRLTPAQKRVTKEIFADMVRPLPMNRLLQGDVGAGKTVVAALAMAKAVSSGYQAAFMAPTEILAQQHYHNLKRIFAGLGINLALLTGSMSSVERHKILTEAVSAQIDILVGTHALIQEQVRFAALGLAIIDEQHRFGVKQRALLSGKGISPDVLVMTATPIPRTLALTVYGDLDLSVIDHLPPDRKPVQTVFLRKAQRAQAYCLMRQQLAAGAQCYVVCPLIEDSEKQDLLAAETIYKELYRELGHSFSVALLHGRMRGAEKEDIMDRFKRGAIQVLVSTTVIEVGIDVPNASVMIIEQAERFGLSQLHQLRGRVGRGSRQSICFLLADPKNPEALQRMHLMTRIQDGFRLAQADLTLRGAGDFWGVRQHGLHRLQVADLARDGDIVELSLQVAGTIPLSNHEHQVYFDLKFSKDLHIASN